MALHVQTDASLSKEEKYTTLRSQLTALEDPGAGNLANTGNFLAALHFTFGFHWTGCYLVKDGQLVLGPFQGPVACTTIGRGKGVCGTAWQQQQTIVVPDVDSFPGHIACSSLSKSEIVVPIKNNKNEIIGVLDIDSDQYNTFDQTDATHLEAIADMLSKYL
ncbi:MAG: GAF domain-containing protein [Flavobacteriales bacterium]|nr:GAF domain-containing protein [Flavobacteriales bacterium]